MFNIWFLWWWTPRTDNSSLFSVTLLSSLSEIASRKLCLHLSSLWAGTWEKTWRRGQNWRSCYRRARRTLQVWSRRTLELPPSYITYVCVDYVVGRVADVSVKLFASIDSPEVDDIPEDDDKARKVEEDEEEDNSEESIDLVVMVWPLGLSLYQHQQSDVTEA